jgi:hypothetical protein
MPERIQRSRAAGWRLPACAVCVTRPGKYGNPFLWTDYPTTAPGDDGALVRISDADRRRFAVDDFEAAVWFQAVGWPVGYPTVEEIRAELAGCDVACWCPLGSPCHGGTLLRIANALTWPPPELADLWATVLPGRGGRRTV